jgi:hypothetical protein
MFISKYLLSNGHWTLSGHGPAASRFSHALLRRLAALSWASSLVLATLACEAQAQTKSKPLPSITPAAAAHVEDQVRAFMRSVAHDVTQQGPLAWCNYFDASPSFLYGGQWAFGVSEWRGGARGYSSFRKNYQANRAGMEW